MFVVLSYQSRIHYINYKLFESKHVKSHSRDPDDKPFPGDDVYLTREHTWKRWDLGEALEELRLLNHPSFSWSKPGPRIVEAKVEIDMRASKKDKFIEEFSRPVPIMHR